MIGSFIESDKLLDELKVIYDFTQSLRRYMLRGLTYIKFYIYLI